MPFPKKFVWGAATASYQIEGGAFEDGRGASIWDTFSHTPGKTKGGDTGDVACDSYHRWAEDIEIMKAMHLQAYRFSIAWPRIFPAGTGAVNPAGFAWYDRFVDALLAAGIEPYVTLYHWDLPQALQDKGGWLNADTARAFAVYAATVAAHFKGRVKYYFTLNEPQCSVGLGYSTGVHAPGYKLDDAAVFTAWHNMIYAHCLAADAIRKADPDAKVGMAPTGASAPRPLTVPPILPPPAKPPSPWRTAIGPSPTPRRWTRCAAAAGPKLRADRPSGWWMPSRRSNWMPCRWGGWTLLA